MTEYFGCDVPGIGGMKNIKVSCTDEETEKDYGCYDSTKHLAQTFYSDKKCTKGDVVH